MSKGGKGSKATPQQVKQHNQAMNEKPPKKDPPKKTVHVPSTRGGQVRGR